MAKKWKVVFLVFFSIVVILVCVVAIMRVGTQGASPQETVNYDKDGLKLEVVYCRPYKKGRLIFGTKEAGALQPFGQYWRLGANDATSLKLNRDVTFAGRPLKAGRYAVYAVPGEKTWQIGINSEANRWGKAEPDYSKDVLTVDVPVIYTDEVTEQLKINFEPTKTGANMVIRWENAMVVIPIG